MLSCDEENIAWRWPFGFPLLSVSAIWHHPKNCCQGEMFRIFLDNRLS